MQYCPSSSTVARHQPRRQSCPRAQGPDPGACGGRDRTHWQTPHGRVVTGMAARRPRQLRRRGRCPDRWLAVSLARGYCHARQIGTVSECRSRPLRARDLNLLETATRSLQASVPRSASYAGRRVRTALLSGVAESVRRNHPSFLDDPKTDRTGTVNALPILRYKAFGGTQVPKSARNRWKVFGSHH
jgi:hypothetical protein